MVVLLFGPARLRHFIPSLQLQGSQANHWMRAARPELIRGTAKWTFSSSPGASVGLGLGQRQDPGAQKRVFPLRLHCLQSQQWWLWTRPPLPIPPKLPVLPMPLFPWSPQKAWEINRNTTATSLVPAHFHSKGMKMHATLHWPSNLPWADCWTLFPSHTTKNHLDYGRGELRNIGWWYWHKRV